MTPGLIAFSGAGVAAALGVALAIGWNAPGQPTPPLSVTRYPHALASTPLHRPNDEMADGISALRGDLGPDPAAGGDAAFHPRHHWIHHPEVAPPPPPDEAVVFRRQVAAIVKLEGQGLAVLLTNQPGDPQGPRLLRLGDLFDGHWRIAALSMNEVVLQDGPVEKRVPLFGSLDGVGAVAQ